MSSRCVACSWGTQCRVGFIMTGSCQLGQESQNPRLGALLLACFAVQVLRLVTGLGSPRFADWKGSSFRRVSMMNQFDIGTFQAAAVNCRAADMPGCRPSSTDS